MSIKIYRQNTTSSTIAPPPSLQYGVMSCDKSGCLYVGDSSNKIVEQMNVVKYREVGNPNLLDNSNFMIAQAGYNIAHNNTNFICDRWNRYLTTGEMTSDGLRLTSSSVSSWIIQNKTLKEAGLAIGENVTISIMMNGTKYTGTVTLSKVDAAASADVAIENDYIESTAYIPSTNTDIVTIIIWIKQTCIIKWVKAEKGSVATPYVPKGYGVELTECQRYFKRVGNRGFRGWATNETNIVCCLTLAPPMRVKPTITPVGTINAFDEVSSVTVIMDSSTGSTVDTARVTAHGTGLTAFRPYSLLGNVDISADL